MKIRSRTTKPARIEMLPLIDIVFLLLVFFIYAMLSMAVHRGLQLDLPGSTRAEKSRKSELSLFVTRAGDSTTGYRLGEKPVSVPDLEGVLSRVCSRPEPPAVLVFGDKAISYQQLYTALDLLNRHGCTTISLQAGPQ
jgi:biopolymer transport protein ExbD